MVLLFKPTITRVCGNVNCKLMAQCHFRRCISKRITCWCMHNNISRMGQKNNVTNAYFNNEVEVKWSTFPRRPVEMHFWCKCTYSYRNDVWVIQLKPSTKDNTIAIFYILQWQYQRLVIVYPLKTVHCKIMISLSFQCYDVIRVIVFRLLIISYSAMKTSLANKFCVILWHFHFFWKKDRWWTWYKLNFNVLLCNLLYWHTISTITWHVFMFDANFIWVARYFGRSNRIWWLYKSTLVERYKQLVLLIDH